MLVFLLGSLLLTSRGEEVKVGADGSSSATFAKCLESYEDEKALECLTSRSPASVVSETDLSGGLSHAMTRGLWKSASHILAIAKGRNLDLVNVVGNTAAGIRRELEAVTASVVHKTEGIIPAYEWAQSVEQVFLQVKWAHKLDAPATLGCVPSQPTFSPTSVSFKAECKDKGKTFLLQLPLFGPIVANNCTWANASVGRAIITLQKLQDGPWPRLLVDAKKPANQGTWCVLHSSLLWISWDGLAWWGLTAFPPLTLFLTPSHPPIHTVPHSLTGLL